MKYSKTLLFIALIAFTHSYTQDLELEIFANNLDRPVNIKHAGSSELYVAEQDGYIRLIHSDGTVNTTAFLDIDNLVKDPNGANDERGLLGLAFHPEFSTNGYFYVNYIDNDGDTVIARYTRSTTNPEIADVDSELIILTYPQPYINHNGGDLAFGSDGYLYISSGDGGSFGDPQGNAQNPLSFLGKILRLDINSTSGSQNYTIPTDNPFVDNTDFLPEIWAYGLRNPWKFSFDRDNGDLWIADVGQNTYEEINRVSETDAATGLNFGWKCYEANEEYNFSDCSNETDFTFPISVYSHFGSGEPKCSITGGYIYRGSTYPNFSGKYFFADLCSQEIGYLAYDNEEWNQTFTAFSGQWSAFGEDINGEIYVADLSGGIIYKIIDPTLGYNTDILSEISVYPNPTHTSFNINFGTYQNTDDTIDISIYDLHGKKVKTIQRNTEMIQNINTAQLSSGIYILKINSQNNKQITHKLVIN